MPASERRLKMKHLVRLWERPSYDDKRFTYYLLYTDEQGRSSWLITVGVSFSKVVQFMNFPKRLSAIFIGSTAILCVIDKHR
jgi:hypothetical protein